jgi:transposase-like protein
MLDQHGGDMKKYTEQAKLAAVQNYCSGNGGLRDVARRHNVNFSSLRQWILGYQTLPEGRPHPPADTAGE